MFPAVPVPENSGIRTPIDVKLKPKWRFNAKGGIFESDAGDRFAPRDNLPKGTKIVYKVPSLVKADETNLSKHERDLRRYMQVILPEDKSPANHLDAVRAWPCVAEAHVAPAISLPAQP
jgi:hypothetical protein